MAEAVGRRELNKLATRRALLDAANDLFSVQGYAATTVREIADRAGVTERTFFRYFAGKEELLVEDLVAQMPVITESIKARPDTEPPLVAVERAIVALIEWVRDRHEPTAVSLFLDRRPASGLGRSVATLTLKFEDAMTSALGDRLARLDPAPADIDLRAAVYGRTAVAILRSALIRDLQLRNTGAEPRPLLTESIRTAFAAASEGWGPGSASTPFDE